jgi:hypothetical protein
MREDRRRELLDAGEIRDGVEIPEMPHRTSFWPAKSELLAFGRPPPPQAEDYRHPGLLPQGRKTLKCLAQRANQGSRDTSGPTFFAVKPLLVPVVPQILCH